MELNSIVASKSNANFLLISGLTIRKFVVTLIMKKAVKICWYTANMTVQCSIVSLDLFSNECICVFQNLNITIYTTLTGKYTNESQKKT